MKKVLLIIILLLFEWVLFFSTNTYENSNLKKTFIESNVEIEIEEYIEENEISLCNEIEEIQKEKHIVYIDAGHGCLTNSFKLNKAFGYATEGAPGESEYTLEFSEKLIEKFKEKDNYIIYKIDDMSLRGVSGSRELFGNSARRDAFLWSDAEILIQIHYDDDKDETLSGGHIIYNSKISDSEDLAKDIIYEMKSNRCRINETFYEGGLSDRNDLTMLSRNYAKPVILVELGFGAPGKMDYDYLREEEVIDRLIDSIIDGVDDYFKNKQ